MKLYTIVPCYNEAKTLPTSFPIINNLLDQTSHALYGILFINDGSDDKTHEILHQQKQKLPTHLKVQNTILHIAHNQGKAAAVFEWLKTLKQERRMQSHDVVLLLDGDIIEPLHPEIIKDIQELFLADQGLEMVIIGADEGYSTGTVMIEASGQRAVKFWTLYTILEKALKIKKDLGYGIEEVLNQSLVWYTEIYTKHPIVTQPAYRVNNPNNSAQGQKKDFLQAREIAKQMLEN